MNKTLEQFTIYRHTELQIHIQGEKEELIKEIEDKKELSSFQYYIGKLKDS